MIILICVNTKAIESYDHAIKLDPTHSKSFHKKGIVLRELKEYDEAIRCFSKALESYDHAVNFDSNNTIRGFYKEKT